MPAQRLEKRAPMFKYKVRIREGTDADITVFDPNRVIDKATYEEPLQYPKRFRLCLSMGFPSSKMGNLLMECFPGERRAPISQ